MLFITVMVVVVVVVEAVITNEQELCWAICYCSFPLSTILLLKPVSLPVLSVSLSHSNSCDNIIRF